MREANDKLAKFIRDEETKWAQWAKVKLIKEDANNTKYFHLIANGQMANIDERRSSNLSKTRGPLLVKKILKTILPIFTRICSGHQPKISSPWLRTKLVIYTKFLKKRMSSTQLTSKRRRSMRLLCKWKRTNHRV
jgi:hypothetical protein